MKAGREIERLRQQLHAGLLPEGEPIYVLYARDALAAKHVRSWADELESLVGPNKESREARSVANMMMSWPIKRLIGRDDHGRVDQCSQGVG